LPASASLWLRGSGIDLLTKSEGVAFALDPNAENNLLSIAQEAVTNVMKHARARNVEIVLIWSSRELCMRVIDDGHGVDQTQEEQGMGLLGMRERVAAIAGRVQVLSSPSGGTMVEVNVPRPRRSRFSRKLKRQKGSPS